MDVSEATLKPMLFYIIISSDFILNHIKRGQLAGVVLECIKKGTRTKGLKLYYIRSCNGLCNGCSNLKPHHRVEGEYEYTRSLENFSCNNFMNDYTST
jgi:hypothetical protein